jgi:hypothetical protein
LESKPRRSVKVPPISMATTSTRAFPPRSTHCSTGPEPGAAGM